MLPSRISRLDSDALYDLGLSTEQFVDYGTGLQSALYKNSVTGEYILANQGTNPLEAADLRANYQNFFGIESAQYIQGTELALELDAKFKDNLVFTGHSLGGGIATAQALATGNRAYVFNPAGLSAGAVGGIELDFASADRLVTRFVVEGDGVDRINALEGTPASVGQRVDIPLPWADKLQLGVGRFLSAVSGGHRGAWLLGEALHGAQNLQSHLIGSTVEYLHDALVQERW